MAAALATPLIERIGQALRPMPGEYACGDQIGCWRHPTRWRLALADGLGHGPAAHHAATTAMHELTANADLDLSELFAHCDRALIDTRGVALAVVDIDCNASLLVQAAVGNIRTVLLQAHSTKRLGGARGIVGAGFDGLRLEYLPLAPGDWLLMFSDGLPENAGFLDTLHAMTSPSDQLAAQLLERWASLRDDASLLLYRHG